MGEGSKAPLTLGRPFLKTARANIDVGKGEIKFDINGTTSKFKFRPRLEVCNMIDVKCSASPPCHRGEAEERRGAEQEGSKEGERSRRVCWRSLSIHFIIQLGVVLVNSSG